MSAASAADRIRRHAGFIETSNQIGADAKRGAAIRPATPLRSMSRCALPEEIADHVHHFAGIGIDQQRVVPVAHPGGSRRSVRQPVLPRIVDPVVAAVIARPQAPPDLVRLVLPAEWIVIETDVEGGTVAVAPVAPVIVA